MDKLFSSFVMHYVIDDDNNDYLLIGVFSSRMKAELAAQSLFDKPGFKESPKILTDEEYHKNIPGFYISEYKTDTPSWIEGFTQEN